MKRIGAIFLLVLAAGTGAAIAGDAAELKILGFSRDGRYFAFEQSGATDAGTFSRITTMDVGANRPRKGSSFSYREEKPSRVTSRVKRIRAAASRLIRRLRISQKGFMTVSIRGIQFEPFEEASRKSLALPSNWFGPETWLVLHQFKMAQRCKNTDTNPIGFALTLERKDARPIQLTHDMTIPASRGCPTHYRIAEAHARRLKDGSNALAVIVENFAPEFEGKNGGFSAVTALIPSVNTTRPQ